jgi:hypothetical protein
MVKNLFFRELSLLIIPFTKEEMAVMKSKFKSSFF